MNDAHLHLILVHFPIVLVPFASLVLLVGLLLKNRSVQSVAFFALVLAAVVGFFAYQLGEGAEELVEHIKGVAESTIETHEDAATRALYATIAAGVLSLLSLLVMKVKPSILKVLGPIVLLTALVSSGLLALTGQAGGKIRHPEAFDENVAAEVGAEEGEDHN